ncbi:MAG: hypothetical protein AUK49_12170 [Betaproteobacteria bacterium CG2_30_68_42]|nr:MAG: hypothetical protein AUK49_12170 [Betaproteobacteria bacterium CG2_30_68_42]
MSKAVWVGFPYPDKAYLHAGARLAKNWERLHRGDREPLPDREGLEALIAANPGLAQKGFDGAKAASALQEAWRLYHCGEFGKAAQAGLALGVPGYTVANKAMVIYANSLETDEARRLDLFQQVAQRCEEQRAAAPRWANAHYLYAYALGRYSQRISVAKALAQGLGGKIRDALTRTLELEPEHADAHIALGTWHAEVVEKVGAMVAGLTYGAKKDAALEHHRRAIELNPESAIARIEYADSLVRLFGKARMKEAETLYAEAARCTPADAMERLDVEAARAELEA